mmetsp:Transcript_68268/g.160542  ORF Transcript_68268/g.160542 Transcript_68268/m.160542 type:complete len:271 (+) Transcript_68268:802-1614(+)
MVMRRPSLTPSTPFWLTSCPSASTHASRAAQMSTRSWTIPSSSPPPRSASFSSRQSARPNQLLSPSPPRSPRGPSAHGSRSHLRGVPCSRTPTPKPNPAESHGESATTPNPVSPPHSLPSPSRLFLPNTRPPKPLSARKSFRCLPARPTPARRPCFSRTSPRRSHPTSAPSRPKPRHSTCPCSARRPANPRSFPRRPSTWEWSRFTPAPGPISLALPRVHSGRPLVQRRTLPCPPRSSFRAGTRSSNMPSPRGPRSGVPRSPRRLLAGGS